MNVLFKRSLGAAAAFAIITSTAFAQEGRYGYRYGSGYRPDGYEQEERGEQWASRPERRAEPLDRVRADLERAAYGMNYLSPAELRRFRQARIEIAEFQGKWEQGRFDWREFDDAAAAIRNVLAGNRLRPADREILEGDLARMREFRRRQAERVEYREGYRDRRW